MSGHARIFYVVTPVVEIFARRNLCYFVAIYFCRYDFWCKFAKINSAKTSHIHNKSHTIVTKIAKQISHNSEFFRGLIAKINYTAKISSRKRTFPYGRYYYNLLELRNDVTFLYNIMYFSHSPVFRLKNKCQYRCPV